MGTELASLLAAAAEPCPTARARTTPAAPKPRSAPLVPWMLFSSHSSSMLASQRGLVAGAARPDGWRNTHLLSAMRDRLRIFTVASSAAARVLLSRSRGAASAWTEDLCSFSSRSVCSHFRSNPVVDCDATKAHAFGFAPKHLMRNGSSLRCQNRPSERPCEVFFYRYQSITRKSSTLPKQCQWCWWTHTTAFAFP